MTLRCDNYAGEEYNTRMGIRLRRAAKSELAALVKHSRSDSLTYSPTGGSLGGPVPAHLKRRHWTETLEGPRAFERGAEALRVWAVHRATGLELAADGPIAIGTNVAFSAPLPIGFVDGTCRIVAVVEAADRFGFAYGSLSVHPERGEESFVVAREPEGGARFDVVGISRPSQLLARLVPPVANRLQDTAVRRYLLAMQQIATNGD